ncbi:MAG: hypothetical protein M3Z20_12265, partial [Chloroflexota bacterium]|nr:hypothetical protein [Chloroflexota bacterium]
MDEIEPSLWIPAAAALAGALIGSLAPLLVALISARRERRQEIARLAFSAGLADMQHSVEVVKLNKGKARIPPLSVYVLYHAEVAKLIMDGIEPTKERMSMISAKTISLALE